MSDLVVIAGVEITTDTEGRFNLNALHRASRAGESKEPNKWLSLKRTSELISALEATEGSFGRASNGKSYCSKHAWNKRSKSGYNLKWRADLIDSLISCDAVMTH